MTQKLTTKELNYIKAVFEYKTNANGLPTVHTIMRDINLIQIFNKQNTSEKRMEISVYDYMLWLRKARKFIYPECNYKIKRKKTVQLEHMFANITLRNLYDSIKGF